MARTLYIPIQGATQYLETGVAGGIVSYEVGSGPWAGSTAEITGTTLTAVHAVNVNFPTEEFNLIAPLPLTAVDAAGLFTGGWLNGTNFEYRINGIVSPHATYRAILQQSGGLGEWFGSKIIVNGQDLLFKGFGRYDNGLPYSTGEVEVIPDPNIYSNSGDTETPVKIDCYADVPEKDQYVFGHFQPTAPGVWESVPEWNDGPFYLSDDSPYAGPDPITIVIDCAPTYGLPPCDLRPFGDGVGTMDDPSSEDNMTGAKGFKLNKGFKHKNGFTAKNGFTKKNGF